MWMQQGKLPWQGFAFAFPLKKTKNQRQSRTPICCPSFSCRHQHLKKWSFLFGGNSKQLNCCFQYSKYENAKKNCSQMQKTKPNQNHQQHHRQLIAEEQLTAKEQLIVKEQQQLIVKGKFPPYQRNFWLMELKKKVYWHWYDSFENVSIMTAVNAFICSCLRERSGLVPMQLA